MSGNQITKRRLSPEEIRNLSNAFSKLSVEVGKYLNDNWPDLTSRQRDILERRQWVLLDIFISLNARYIDLKVKLSNDQLDTLLSSTKVMNRAANSIKDTKRAVSVATKAVGYGGAIYLAALTGDVLGLIKGAEAIIKELS